MQEAEDVAWTPATSSSLPLTSLAWTLSFQWGQRPMEMASLTECSGGPTWELIRERGWSRGDQHSEARAGHDASRH